MVLAVSLVIITSLLQLCIAATSLNVIHLHVSSHMIIIISYVYGQDMAQVLCMTGHCGQ